MELAQGAPYLTAFESVQAQILVDKFVGFVTSQKNLNSLQESEGNKGPLFRVEGISPDEAIRVGVSALNAFLQANVTGPILEGTKTSEKTFVDAFEKFDAASAIRERERAKTSLDALRKVCLRSLDTDGVSVYEYIPHIELFCLARCILTSDVVLPTSDVTTHVAGKSLAWVRFRVHMWHYKLLSQPSLGPGSLFTKAGRWTDVASLQELVEQSLSEAEQTAESDAKVEFLLEKASAHILLGNDAKAKEALQQAADFSGFVYTLSGALGKRTRFQEHSTSQLIVLAKSAENATNGDKSREAVPDALPLNNDTLLEKVAFDKDGTTSDSQAHLPTQLRGLTPGNQPQLKPEDQIILLTEATLKDTFSPTDSLTCEEILPFAVRVIEDKSTNWQIYTQALLVRSRIELGRSRTLERGVLQMQAVVDQVLVDIDASTKPAEPSESDNESPWVPAIKVSGTDQEPEEFKPRSFLPAAKPTESAPADVRLKYVNALSSPPRWHLEAELAYAWTSVGSLISAIEIFKRLRLWAEVALCLASSAASEDEDGRGSGGEEKARAIVRWRLFQRIGESAAEGDNDLDEVVDVNALDMKDFYGPERNPPPPNAPRLFCILGDLENEPAHYQRAWEISNKRYSRAQRSMGELYLRNKKWEKAGEAYRLAVNVNRLSPELWSRLGDIELRLGCFANAAEAFQRAIATSNGEEGGEGARTWSNLGTALLSWYRVVLKEGKTLQQAKKSKDDDDEHEGDDLLVSVTDNMPATQRASEVNKPAYKLLQDSLTAFKRGATIAHDNWRIWDNVVTLAASLTPKPDLNDVILGTQNVLRIRNSEEALDLEILGLLVREVAKDAAPAGEGVYEPSRGTLQSKVLALFDNDAIPLITTNSEAWALVSRLSAWRRDWDGAVDAAEKGWRAATGGSAGSTLSTSTGAQGNWTTNREGWEIVVERTSELIAAYENWGSKMESIGSRWKGKARSAVRSVMGRAKETWEGDAGWTTLESLLEDLRA